MLFSGMISQSTTQGFERRLQYESVKKRETPFNLTIGQKSARKGFQYFPIGCVTLAVSQGRNEDKWSKVQPCEVEKICILSSFSSKLSKMQINFYFEFYAPKAQKELDQSLFRDLRSALTDCGLSEKGLQSWVLAVTRSTVGEIVGLGWKFEIKSKYIIVWIEVVD